MNWTIDMIWSLCEKGVKEFPHEKMVIKGHDIYFVDFEGYFGYSVLVFLNGAHIYYANDYELHHRSRERDELKEYYIEKMNNILWTEAEIVGPVKDYDEYRRKEYYLRNYLAQKYDDRMSAVFVGSEEERTKRWEKTRNMYYDPVTFSYYKEKAIVKKHLKLFDALVKAMHNHEDDYEYWKEAFLREMANHEYNINWQADYDTLSAFGNLEFKQYEDDGVECYFDQLEFSDTKRAAYKEARDVMMRRAS